MTDRNLQSPDPVLSAALDATVDQQTDGSRSVIAGRYVVLNVIASGSAGRVLRADDRILRRQVAVKIPHAAADQDSAEQFLHEARSAASIRHPGIVTVHDFGQETDGSCYLVEDLIDGMSLAALFEDGPLDLGRTMNLMADIADAVHAAHECGLVHRDLKPANILLDQSRQPFVTDFGLALVTGRPGGSTGRISGTPVYMSPEQTRGESDHLDARSDLWSLGVMLYELLTGRRPFPADSIPVLFQQIQNDAVAAPSEFRPDIPPRLDRICLQCLAKNPADRFADARQLAAELRTALDHIALVQTTDMPSRREPVRKGILAASFGVSVLTFAGFGLLAIPVGDGSPPRSDIRIQPTFAIDSESVEVPQATRRLWTDQPPENETKLQSSVPDGNSGPL